MALFAVTARSPEGKVLSYRFLAEDREAAKIRADQLCREGEMEFIRLTKLGAPVNTMEAWVP